mgnify:CR=1 FL=1
MAKRDPKSTRPEKERAFLVGIYIRSEPQLLSLEDSLAELRLLADTAGLVVVGETTQTLEKPHPDTFIGSGKVEEIIALAEETMSNLIIFDAELSPRHQRELEERFQNRVRVIDRTALILDIFAQHASTREGILQVELAQYEYRLPRLTRAWTHLARQAGGASGRSGSAGGVGLRGPGETQLEVDRREIRNKISHLKSELEKVRSHRSRYRAQRKRSQIPIVALVGYTNAGKSTLLNHLSHSNVYVADQLFATLDPTTRRVQLPDNHWVLFTDTVGFIQKLPTQLIAAFRATLEEITEADLLVHMVDITHPNALAQWKAVQNTLVDINADHIPAITAMNKIDLLPHPEMAGEIIANTPLSVAISAKKGSGIGDLLSLVEKQLYETQIPLHIRLPYQEGNLISLIHEQGRVISLDHERNGVVIVGSVPGRLFTQFQPYFIHPDTATEDE